MGKIAKVQEVTLDKLIPYVNNAKIHNEEQVTKIASSIREFGFLSPVLIDAKYNIIAGHGRVLGAKKLGMTEVPCLFVEDLTETQKRAYILADNKLALDAGWDDEILRQEIKALDDLNFDVSLTGFDIGDFDFTVCKVLVFHFNGKHSRYKGGQTLLAINDKFFGFLVSL